MCIVYYSSRPEKVEYPSLPVCHSFGNIAVSEISIPPNLRLQQRQDQSVKIVCASNRFAEREFGISSGEFGLPSFEGAEGPATQEAY